MDIHVRIDGRDFPCRPTMGAMRRYRAMTGKEATSINWESPVDMTDYLYCCTASACRHDGVDFPVLSPGENTITLGSGITQIQITPRWWVV